MKKVTRGKPKLPIIKKTVNDLRPYRMGFVLGPTYRQMKSLLGSTNSKRDPEKLKWEFFYDGIRCMIWDYKKSYQEKRWSYYEENEGTIKKLFTGVPGAKVITNEEIFQNYLKKKTQ